MTTAGLVEPGWLQDYVPNQVRLRCAYKRQGKNIIQYTAQLELFHEGVWKPIVRYDNAHGFCHRDNIHPDGTQDKIAMFIGTANETFTRAVKEIQSNWESHVARYLGEIRR